MQEDLASQTDVIGSADVAPTGMMALFQRAATGGQDRQDAFVLGDRASMLHHLDQPAIIPHVAESEHKKFSFEVPPCSSSCCVTCGVYNMQPRAPVLY